METLAFYLRPDSYPISSHQNATLLQDIAVVCSSFLFCCAVCLFSLLIASRYSFTYRFRLKEKERFFWHFTTIRAMFGVWATREGLWAIFSAEELHRDIAQGVTARSYFDALVCLGFFLFEGLTVTGVDMYYGRWQVLLNIHHWLGVVCYLCVLIHGKFHFFSTAAMVLEMSTPFSGLCWTLIKIERSKTMIWRVNQFLLLHAFHLRSVVECYFWYLTYHNWDLVVAQVGTVSFWTCYVSMVLVSVFMTPYWTYRKTVQFVTGEDWNFEAKNGTSSNGHSKHHAPLEEFEVEEKKIL